MGAYCCQALSKKMERVMGIEPTRPAWKAGILPLNYTRTIIYTRGFFFFVLPLGDGLYYIKLLEKSQ
jgi:hypothetical protein